VGLAVYLGYSQLSILTLGPILRVRPSPLCLQGHQADRIPGSGGGRVELPVSVGGTLMSVISYPGGSSPLPCLLGSLLTLALFREMEDNVAGVLRDSGRIHASPVITPSPAHYLFGAQAAAFPSPQHPHTPRPSQESPCPLGS
jgi:hypothetical protein